MTSDSNPNALSEGCGRSAAVLTIVSLDDKIYVYGLGTGGRLGTHNEKPQPIPLQCLNNLSLKLQPLRIKGNGHVYSFGSNRFGQFGGSTDSPYALHTSSSTRGFSDCPCRGRSPPLGCSQRQWSGILLGDNTARQLGRHSTRNTYQPQLVALPSTTCIAASDQSTVVVTTKQALNRYVHEWGHGQAVPHRLSLEDTDPVNVASARHHTVVLTERGRVWMIQKGQATLVPLDGAVHVAASDHHTAAVTRSGHFVYLGN